LEGGRAGFAGRGDPVIGLPLNLEISVAETPEPAPEPTADDTLDQANDEPIAMPMPHEAGDEESQSG
jgi:hypothetical protein